MMTAFLHEMANRFQSPLTHRPYGDFREMVPQWTPDTIYKTIVAMRDQLVKTLDQPPRGRGLLSRLRRR
jgi:hypothetical protein